MNNKYIITVKDPLLRPGMTIQTEASENYVADVCTRLMEIVREVNGNTCEIQGVINEDRNI